MTRLRAFHLPIPDPALHVVAAHDGVEALAPALTAHDIATICSDLRAARERLLGMPVSRVISAVDAAARRLRNPDEPVRHDVLLALSAISGCSRPMAEHVLDRMSEDWLAPALESLVQDQLGGAAAIESFITRGSRRLHAVGEPLGLHVFAGNVPGVGVTSIIRALLVRSAVIAKTAAAEPVLTPTFARLLADEDAHVGACVAVTCWRGGTVALEDAALAHVDMLVQYGGAPALAALRARTPPRVRTVEHGPRLSLAIIDAAHAHAATADDLAYAVAVFDQQGCVSPQTACVIGSTDHARRLAERTADALAELQVQLPRGRIDAAEAAAIRALRDRAEFGAIAGRAVDVWGPQGLEYSVILSDQEELEGSCLNRTLIIKPVASLDHVLDAIRPAAHILQTVGVEGFDAARLQDLAVRLGTLGASRVTPIRDMPWPPATWHHDGRGPLLELVRWLDLEVGTR